jgi:hypothetical protein
VNALRSEQAESYEKEYVKVDVDNKHLPFKKMAMVEQMNSNATGMQIIAHFLWLVLLKGQGREM